MYSDCGRSVVVSFEDRILPIASRNNIRPHKLILSMQHIVGWTRYHLSGGKVISRLYI
jgi:hypothetical protein